MLISLTGDSGFDIGGLIFTNILLQSPFFQPVISFFGFGKGIDFFYPIIWLAKYLVTGENPKKMTRGMDFFYNVVDWVGGYPYEYASIKEIEELMSQFRFRTIKIIPSQVPTGCNEFVFVKMT